MQKIKIILKWIVYLIGYLVAPLLSLNKKFQDVYISHKMQNNFAVCGNNPRIGYPIYQSGAKYAYVGDNFISRPGLRLECLNRYNDQIFHPHLTIGDNFMCHYGCHIGCINNIAIGNNVTLGSHVLIIDHSHGSNEDLDIPVMKRPLHSKGPIKIGDNVWIGENVCIMENVSIGKNSIIGANAVVTHNIPPRSVAVGVPAKVIKQL